MALLLSKISNQELVLALQEARTRTLELVADLNDEQMIGPRLDIVNPLRWEIAHVAWFQEYWVLRHLRRSEPIWAEADQLYDSARIAHATRWDLPLPSRPETIEYMQRILARLVEQATIHTPDVNEADDRYFLQLALFHEDMHAEAITYTRQTLGYPAPRITLAQAVSPTTKSNEGGKTVVGSLPSLEKLGDAEIPGGVILLGSEPGIHFVFDNEMRAHPVELRPFAISRTAVTNADFASFVDDGGYRRREIWDDDGWRWRESADAEHPLYWQAESGGRKFTIDLKQAFQKLSGTATVDGKSVPVTGKVTGNAIELSADLGSGATKLTGEIKGNAIGGGNLTATRP